MRILAIDPGVTTGYCVAELLNPTDAPGIKIELSPFQWVDDVDDAWNRIEKIQPRYIIIEDFEYRNKSRAGLVLFSVQLIGVVRLYEAKCGHQCAVVTQKAAQGKSYYSDKTLKALDLYKRGVPHGMDATRHLLHWLTFGAGYQFTQGHQIKDLARLK